MRSLIIALQFLTIVPFVRSVRVDEAAMARSSRAFPFAGMIEGARVAEWLSAGLGVLLAYAAAHMLVPGAAGGYVFTAVSLGANYALAILLVRFFDRSFGGMTGDTLGASGELAELTFLLR